MSGQHKHGYTIRQVDRFDAGRYTCTADNGVGSPASAQIALQVLCESRNFDNSNIGRIKKRERNNRNVLLLQTQNAVFFVAFYERLLT